MDEKLKKVIGFLEDKKALDVRAYDVSKSSGLWETFVMCTGTSKPHLHTLYSNLDEQMSKEGYKTYYRDIGRDSDWIIVDFGDILVHIFGQESRMYYSLERLWGETEVRAGAAAKTVKPKRSRAKKTVKRKAGAKHGKA